MEDLVVEGWEYGSGNLVRLWEDLAEEPERDLDEIDLVVTKLGFGDLRVDHGLDKADQDGVAHDQIKSFEDAEELADVTAVLEELDESLGEEVSLEVDCFVLLELDDHGLDNSEDGLSHFDGVEVFLLLLDAEPDKVGEFHEVFAKLRRQGL